jgi:hypothetical protein
MRTLSVAILACAACAAPAAPPPDGTQPADVAGAEALLDAQAILADALAEARVYAAQRRAPCFLRWERDRLVLLLDADSDRLPSGRDEVLAADLAWPAGITRVRAPQWLRVSPDGRLDYPADYVWVAAATFEQVVRRAASNAPAPDRADIVLRAGPTLRLYLDLDESFAQVRAARLFGAAER